MGHPSLVGLLFLAAVAVAVLTKGPTPPAPLPGLAGSGPAPKVGFCRLPAPAFHARFSLN